MLSGHFFKSWPVPAHKPRRTQQVWNAFPVQNQSSDSNSSSVSGFPCLVSASNSCQANEISETSRAVKGVL